ncbi:MAG: sigma-54-dependent transcriptional regulator [Desulfurivibrionaceae bacterium]
MTSNLPDCKTKILLAEDDEIMRITLSDHLQQHKWKVDEATNGREALELIKTGKYQLVLSDIRMPGMDGSRLLEAVKQRSPDTDVILMTAYGGTENAVECLKNGATDYILKPFDLDDLTIRIKRLLEIQKIKARCVSLEDCCRNRQTPIIGSSPAVRKMLQLTSQVAMSDTTTVLITGESGNGKELVASAIHYSSERMNQPYIRINCASIPQGLLESELFGHEKGAFTGAENAKKGKFELASNGTILLDEIGEMDINLQAKLLRVLQEKEIERVGGTRTIPVNVRIICSTSRDLAEEIKKGTFRDDLYYRFQVVPIEVPPLRERKEDIPELCNYFLREFSKEENPLSITPEALDALQSYDYPGNIRELKNIIERLTVLSPSPCIQVWNLPPDLNPVQCKDGTIPVKLSEAVSQTEKKCILQALHQSGGNRTEAAGILGISRKNLWEKLKLHNLHP